MKQTVLAVLAAVLIFGGAAYAETNLDPLNCHRIDASWVFFRSAYYYPVSGVSYTSPDLGIPLSVSASVRSYGSFYLVSIQSFDVLAAASWQFSIVPRMFRLSTGAGAELKARLYNDVRSTAQSGFDPLIVLGAHASFDWCTISLPVTVRLYSDGAGFSAAPEAAVRLWFIGVFARSEITWTISAGNGQWYLEHYAGVRFYL